jgi:hypothetical protein
VRVLLIPLAAAIVVGLAGWAVVIARATDDEGAVQRDRSPTAAEVEDFARLDLPPSTRALATKHAGGIDDWLQATFVVERADVEPLLTSARLQAKRVDGELRAEENTPGYHRRMTIRFDTPGTASVHLVAFTT